MVRVPFCSLSGTKQDTENLECAEGRLGEGTHNSGAVIPSGRSQFAGSLQPWLVCVTWRWGRFLKFFWSNCFPFKTPHQLSLPRKDIEKELPNDSSVTIKLIWDRPDPW